MNSLRPPLIIIPQEAKFGNLMNIPMNLPEYLPFGSVVIVIVIGFGFDLPACL